MHACVRVCVCVDFDVGNGPLPEKKALRNLRTVCDFCTSHFSPSAFHIAPIDLLQWAESGLLNSNILALLAYLFHLLEVERVLSTRSSCITSSSDHSLQRSQFSILRSASDTSIGGSQLMSDSVMHHGQKPLTQVLPHSQSTETADALATVSAPELEYGKASLIRSNNLNKESKLSAEPHIDSTVFYPPLHSSLSSMEVSTLASFRKERTSESKGTSSLISPVLSVLRSPTPSRSHASQNTSFAVNNHELVDETNAIPRTKSFVIKQKFLLEQSEAMVDVREKSPEDSSLCEPNTKDELEEHGSSKSETFFWPHEEAILPTFESPKDDITDHHPIRSSSFTKDKGHTFATSAAELSSFESTEDEKTDHQPIRSESFTVNKEYTSVTANAAGLPVVDNMIQTPIYGASTPTYKETTVNTLSEDCKIVENDTETPLPAPPVAGSNNGVIILTNFLELHHRHDGKEWKCSPPAGKDSIPPEVKELKVNLAPVIASFQSQNIHMETKVMLQMIKLHSMRKTTTTSASVWVNVPASVSFSQKTLDDGGSGATTSGREDPLATAGSPCSHSLLASARQTYAGVGTGNVEAFEKNEELILQNTTPCASDTETTPERGIVASSNKRSPLFVNSSVTTHVGTESSALDSKLSGEASLVQPPPQLSQSPRTDILNGSSGNCCEHEVGASTTPNPWVRPMSCNTPSVSNNTHRVSQCGCDIASVVVILHVCL